MRYSSLIFALALVAACGEPGAGTTSVPTTEAAPEAMVLSYQFEAGTTLQYEVIFDQHLTMTATGDGSALGEEEMPGNADLEISGTTTFTHSVEEGAQPGTFDITIVGDFNDLQVTGTVDGEPVDSGEIPELAAIEPVETTITVDEQGNVVSGTGDDMGLGGALGGDPTGPGGLAAPGMNLGTLVGPSLTEGEVTVGDTWSETVENPMGFGEGNVTTTVESEVTGTDTIDGADVFVIESDSSTSAIEFDLAEMMIGFFAAFMPEEATPEERAELEAMMDELRFLMTVDPSSYHSTAWFDPEAGLARRSESAGSTRMTFDVNFPDETTGEMVAFAMDMTMDQEVSYRFLGTDSA
jgi:hypothetical protein